MLTAHLPLGYLVTKATIKTAHYTDNPRALMFLGLIGSVFPDFDMLYFYLIDNSQHHHHTYWTHIPIFWFGIFLILGVLLKIFKAHYLPFLVVFGVNVIIHLITDTIVGDIKWLYPWTDSYFALATVPARYQPWWLNFIFHWSFVVELFIIVTALYFLLKPNNKHR